MVDDRSISPARPEAVIDVLIPFVAEGLRSKGHRLPRLQAGDRRYFARAAAWRTGREP